jgi:phosphodiesterase/alkaline phosphatase D-like protein
VLAVAALAIVPAAAQAAKPTGETDAASNVAQFSAELHGIVNPNGSEVTECKFEYGTTSSYGSSVACIPAPGSGTGGVEVHASVTGLLANTTYHYRVVATSAGGTGNGSDVTFKTLAQVPLVATTGVSSVTQTGATLDGTVNPDGEEVTGCKFEYGTTTSYGSAAACTSAPGSGTSPVAVSGSAGSLSANTTYHFRVSATNSSGTSTGADRTFTTATPHYYVNGAKLKEGVASAKTFISWGNLTFTGQGGCGGFESACITCHYATAGTLFNPAGAAAGEGSIQAFAPFACEQQLACPKTAEIRGAAENLPWHDLLT